MEPINVDDYEALARRKLPKPIYDFIAGGAEDEVTLRENRAAFQRVLFRPRVLTDVSSIDTSSTVLGERVAFPVLLAPAGAQRLAHPDGELASAKAAAAAGTIFVLSTTSSYSIEEVAGTGDAPRWFQLHFNPDRGVTTQLVQRAEASGYRALCVTVDMQAPPRRERDIRNRPQFVPAKNLVGLIEPGSPLSDPALSWEGIDWLRSLTSMPIILKGIMTAEDARMAVEHGVEAIIVSNHGGRQLDGAMSTMEALEEVVAAAGGRCEVLIDGGVRRGTDVLKALALGAKGVLVGRAYLWGLAVAGEAGVRRIIELLKYELETAMALSGCATVAEVNRDLIALRSA